MIPRYLVRWMRDIESTRAHTIMFVRFLFSKLEPNALIRARLAVSKIPLTWAEDLLKEGTYFGTICLPVEEYAEAFRFISKNVNGFSDKLQCLFIDSAQAALFTIPFQMYDPEKGWMFDDEGLRLRFSQLASVLKGR